MKDILRQRLELSTDDTSMDHVIDNYTPKQRLEELCGWHLGDTQWADQFLGWAKLCGYEVKEGKPTMDHDTLKAVVETLDRNIDLKNVQIEDHAFHKEWHAVYDVFSLRRGLKEAIRLVLNMIADNNEKESDNG